MQKERNRKELIKMTPIQVVEKIELQAALNTDMVDKMYLSGFRDCITVLKTLFIEQEVERKKYDKRK